MPYIHQRETWPQLRWRLEALEERLGAVRHGQGRLIGKMEGMGFQLKTEAILQTLTEDVTKSSEIEGEMLDKDQVRSSIARRLGLDAGGLTSADRNIEGVVEMMLDATQSFDKPLTKQRLCGWHGALFPTGRSGLKTITVGAWRKPVSDPMQVVSGPAGRERVHFEAPAARRLEKEMAQFLAWLEKGPAMDPVLKAGVAHLWFVTIHPFEDGNGRIARAIADLALARSENSPQRFYSMSAQIRAQRKAYYDVLEDVQKGDGDITEWLVWFLDCLGNAVAGADKILAGVLQKARFWENANRMSISERQRSMLNRMLDGFEGKLTSSKWAKITDVSQDTALRDIKALIEQGILVEDAPGGRSTSYSLADLTDF
jgi:Fic family protein